MSAHIELAHIREAKGNFYIVEIRTAWCDWRVPVSCVLGIHPRVHSTWRTPGTRSSFLLSDFHSALAADRGFMLFCLQLSCNLGTIAAGFTDSALSSSRHLPVPKIVLRMYVLSSLPECKLHCSKKSVLCRLRPWGLLYGYHIGVSTRMCYMSGHHCVVKKINSFQSHILTKSNLLYADLVRKALHHCLKFPFSSQSQSRVDLCWARGAPSNRCASSRT